VKCSLVASTALILSLQLVSLLSERRSTVSTTQDVTKLPASDVHTVHSHQQLHQLRRLKETEDRDKIRKDAAVSGECCNIYSIGPGDGDDDEEEEDDNNNNNNK